MPEELNQLVQAVRNLYQKHGKTGVFNRYGPGVAQLMLDLGEELRIIGGDIMRVSGSEKDLIRQNMMLVPGVQAVEIKERVEVICYVDRDMNIQTYDCLNATEERLRSSLPNIALDFRRKVGR